MPKPRKPLPRSTTSIRRSPLPASRKKIKTRRVSKRFAKRRDPIYKAWIKTWPCFLWALRECDGPIDPAHVQSRGAGGYDRKNLVPLCRKHHDEQEHGTGSFQIKYRVDLTTVALRIDEAFVTGREGGWL